jgi:amino-acid N-acetyltransferase
MADIPELIALIGSFASRGIMLPRTEFEMAENIRDFSVICTGVQLLGCGALHFYTPHAAEIRSLAVAPEFHGSGGGTVLMNALEAEAQAFGVHEVFAFTYVPDFFRKFGFAELQRGALPLKAWKDCLRCPKFQCCDEIAVIKRLHVAQIGVNATPTSGDVFPLKNLQIEDVHLPIIRNTR